MVSKIIRITPEDDERLSSFAENELTDCTAALGRGELIVFPTETVYGLGVDINNDPALERLLKVKKRPTTMPIAVAVANLAQARQVVEVPELAVKIVENCLPKPITMLLPVKKGVSNVLPGGSELIGLRFPDNPVTAMIIDRFGPITATSANLHGTPSPATIAPALEQFGDQVEIYIDTGRCRFGQPSTVVDISSETIKIIRDGACSGKELKDCLQL